MSVLPLVAGSIALAGIPTSIGVHVAGKGYKQIAKGEVREGAVKVIGSGVLASIFVENAYNILRNGIIYTIQGTNCQGTTAIPLGALWPHLTDLEIMGGTIAFVATAGLVLALGKAFFKAAQKVKEETAKLEEAEKETPAVPAQPEKA